MADEEHVLYEVGDDRVAVITFNHPDRMNGLTEDFEDAYFDALLQAEADANVGAIVVTGSGRAFCAGADMSILDDASTGKRPLLLGGLERRPVYLPTTIKKPVICAINGSAAGVGVAMALVCDIRFAAEGVKITFAFPQRGLVAEYDTSWILPRIVGLGRALDLLLSGRVVLAEEAKELGLVNQVVPKDELLDAARAYAAEIAATASPASLAMIKQQVYADLDVDLVTAHERTTPLMLRAFKGPDFTEGVASYVEKRAPKFPNLGEGTEFTFMD